VIERFDTLRIANIKFSNVIHITCEIFDYERKYIFNEGYHAIDEFWVSKNEGIIKKIIRNPLDTVVWVLQRFQILNNESINNIIRLKITP
jgi:hypothetical protein